MFLLLATLLSSATPQQYSNIDRIFQFARAHQTDPYELLAISFTETRFKEDLVSSTGDVGLMQVNCKVWHKEFNMKYTDCFDILKKPERNLSISFSILQKYKNNKLCKKGLVYNCYNGGPGWRVSENRERIERYGKLVRSRRVYFEMKWPTLEHYDYQHKMCISVDKGKQIN